MNWRVVDWKLKNKVILHIFVIGLISISTLGVLFFHAEKDLIHSLARQKMELVGTMIDCNVRHQMIMGDTKAVGINLNRLTDTSSIQRLRILDFYGTILTSSDPSEGGSRLPEPERSRLQQLYADQDPSTLFEIKPVTRVKSYIALANRPACMGCHAPADPFNGILEVKLDESLEKSLMTRNRIQGALIALATLAILTFVIFRLYERVINRPLIQLRQHMKQVEGGDLAPRLQPRKKDEFGELARSFNAMVERLQQADREIKALHSRQMERAGHLASLGELAAGLAHEIKNPIAGIKGSMEVIKGRTDPSDPQREIFCEILMQTERIYQIIQDLLDYAGPKELDIKPVNPSLCVQNAIQLAGTQIQDKRIRINFQGLEQDVVAHCDAEKMKSVILNLLINSIAATDRSGEISISLSIPPTQELEICIADTGRGIAPDELDKIFQPFFTTRKQGTGLGLSICKQIVDAHGGTITVASNPGEGSAFTIRLPLKPEGEGFA